MKNETLTQVAVTNILNLKNMTQVAVTNILNLKNNHMRNISINFNFMVLNTEAYWPHRTSKMERFSKIVEDFSPLSTFTKHSYMFYRVTRLWTSPLEGKRICLTILDFTVIFQVILGHMTSRMNFFLQLLFFEHPSQLHDNKL